MATLKILGDTSGEIAVTVPASAGTNTLTLPARTDTVLCHNSTGDVNLHSNTIVLDSTNSRVGIGTTSPAGKFAVSDGTVTIDVNPTSNLGYLGTRSNHPIAFTVNAVEEMRLEADGDLHVDGDVIAFSTTISDVALKSDIEVIPNALDKVNEIRGVTFTRHNGRTGAGIIAQELEKVLPQAVKEKLLPLQKDDNKKYKTVEYDSIHGLLIEAIKELSKKVEQLEKEKR